MDRTDYVSKANQIFDERKAYAPLAVDPTKKPVAAIKKKANELARLKFISPNGCIFMGLGDSPVAFIQKIQDLKNFRRRRVPVFGPSISLFVSQKFLRE
ncbi:hypothetical protein SprV_0100331900 [Sparganum proliferum]